MPSFSIGKLAGNVIIHIIYPLLLKVSEHMSCALAVCPSLIARHALGTTDGHFTGEVGDDLPSGVSPSARKNYMQCKYRPLN